MNKGSHTLLAVGDAGQDLRFRANALKQEGFVVVTAAGPEEALEAAKQRPPDLILIQGDMKACDPFAFCRQILAFGSLATVPVVFTLEDSDRNRVDAAFAAGAMDVIHLPCSRGEFMGRLATQIRLRHLILEMENLRLSDIDANPLTHLPGNNTIVTVIQEALDAGDNMAVIYSDMDHFKAYNDVYGFSAGDDVILFNAETLQTALRKVCGEEGFIGHVGGDDFVILLPARCVEEFGAMVTIRFDAGAPQFYSDEDRERGSILAESRTGVHLRFPLLSISLGGVILRDHDFKRFVEVAEACADVKHMAKTRPGSNLFMDRRTMDAHGPSFSPLDSIKIRI